MGQRILDLLDTPTAPRRDGHARRLGESLGFDLVAELAHDGRVGANEHDSESLTQLGERRILGNEAPADPGGLRARGHERALERRIVEVAAGRCPSASTVIAGPRR